MPTNYDYIVFELSDVKNRLEQEMPNVNLSRLRQKYKTQDVFHIIRHPTRTNIAAIKVIPESAEVLRALVRRLDLEIRVVKAAQLRQFGFVAEGPGPVVEPVSRRVFKVIEEPTLGQRVRTHWENNKWRYAAAGIGIAAGGAAAYYFGG